SWEFVALYARASCVQWLAEIDVFWPGQEWAKLHRPDVVNATLRRLSELATWLGDREYLEGRFTVGDLLMTTVLRILRHTDLMDCAPRLKAYQARCEARPAFQPSLR